MHLDVLPAAIGRLQCLKAYMANAVNRQGCDPAG